MKPDPTAELHKAWALFPVGPSDPIALRAIPPKGAGAGLPARNLTFTARDFPGVDARQQAFAEAAVELNEEGYNIYTCLNPIQPSFTGNRINGRAVRDIDIGCRRYLLIDLDRAQSTAGPATDEELAEADLVADRIAEFLAEEHGHATRRVMSGNGVHLYLPLADFPNNAPSKACCQQVLQGLARRFDTDAVKVDTSVFNASRITKVPGTIARKGLELPGRPYRFARVIS